MPSPLHVRRQRQFRPVRYSPRHKQVVTLYALGTRRRKIAQLTGYSIWHISRIIGMQEAGRDIKSVDNILTTSLVDAVVGQLTSRVG